MNRYLQNLAVFRPLWFVGLVLAGLQLFVLIGLAIGSWLHISLAVLDLPLLLANALLAVWLLRALGWWQAVGFNHPRKWQNLHLLILPTLLLVVPPLFFPFQIPGPIQIVSLVIITLLIGFQEEAIFRGVLLRALLPGGILFAVFISAALFGVIHLNSLLVGRDPLFVASQVVASFLGAIGLAALRLRINSIWPLVLLHALNDFVQFGAIGTIEAHTVALYIPIMKIVISSIMAAYGLYLLRDLWRDESRREALKMQILSPPQAESTTT